MFDEYGKKTQVLVVKAVQTPVGLKHYDYPRWLGQTLDALNAQCEGSDAIEVLVHVPCEMIASIGDKRFDRLMAKVQDERTTTGMKRYPNIQRVDVQESGVNVSVLSAQKQIKRRPVNLYRAP